MAASLNYSNHPLNTMLSVPRYDKRCKNKIEISLMARKKSKKTHKIKRLIKLMMAIALTVSSLFAAVYAVDFVSRQNLKIQPTQKLFFTDNKDVQQAKDNRGDPQLGKISPEFLPSFFQTLKSGIDIERFSGQKEKNIFSIEKIKTSFSGDDKKQKRTSITASAEPALSDKLTYQIQVGSFKHSEKANLFAEKLAGKGYEVHVSATTVKGAGSVFRVRIGRYKDLEKAQELAGILQKREHLDVFITSR